MSRDHNALVLNADYRPMSYFPLSVMPWQDAIRLVYKQVVTVVAEYADVVRSPSVTMRIPSVIALRQYQHPARHVAFTRFNVFLRDRFRCQYCGSKFQSQLLTFDHVVPQSSGGLTSWENVVAACEPCNAKKDNRADMRPLRMPFKPNPHQLAAAKQAFPPNYLHESWRDFLYWDTVLESS